MNYLTEL